MGNPSSIWSDLVLAWFNFRGGSGSDLVPISELDPTVTLENHQRPRETEHHRPQHRKPRCGPPCKLARCCHSWLTLAGWPAVARAVGGSLLPEVAVWWLLVAACGCVPAGLWAGSHPGAHLRLAAACGIAWLPQAALAGGLQRLRKPAGQG
ncbi:hypothetical protein NE237_023770 [Protea cynaroides]|uniref:Uncharacterized protein n=1 Tax=Protea cynaroides TaxID=273540 RepID=A0A9Q0HC43_9MAGN|nr:hypothetical protein NE237_023770 [Protea cynaroides]